MKRIFFLILSLLTLSSCLSKNSLPVGHDSFENELLKISSDLQPGESVAVSWFYDQGNGDVTTLGNQWRDRTEAALKNAGLTVKVRQDIGFIIDDQESFGPSRSESEIWQEAGADIIISAAYQINRSNSAEINLTIKAMRANDVTLVKIINWSEPLGHNGLQQAIEIKGNVFHRSLETVVGPAEDKPSLNARLDRSPACYPTGGRASITIDSEPDIHLYILNMAADNTVTLVYPNSRLPDKPQPGSTFVFPPPSLASSMELQLYPLSNEQVTQESFKIVASKHPLDFSFLPLPENEIFIGAKGGNMKEMLGVLKQAKQWNEKSLNYWVGQQCGQKE